MKQKKMHFSLRLLWEGFQQCKMIGIFSAVIVVLGAVLEPVAQAISLSSSPLIIPKSSMKRGPSM